MTSEAHDLASPSDDAQPLQLSSVASIGSPAVQISASEIIGALSLLVKTASDAHEIHQVEQTKRTKLQTYRDTEVARIKSSERMLREYFDQIFAERQQVHHKLFDTLDQALETRDATLAQTAVQGIVDVAAQSPLADLGNLGELTRAMADPDAIFEL